MQHRDVTKSIYRLNIDFNLKCENANMLLGRCGSLLLDVNCELQMWRRGVSGVELYEKTWS